MAWRDFQKIDFKIKKIFMGKFKQFKKAVKYFSEQYPEEPITFRDLLLVMEASERIIKEEGGEKEDVEEEAFRKDGEVIKEKYELPDAEDKPKVRLDSEKRNRKLGLLAEVKLTMFVRTKNF